MSMSRMVGIVILCVGVALCLYGVNASHSMGERLSNTFTGRFSDRTTWQIIGGAALGLFGFFVIMYDGRGKSR